MMHTSRFKALGILLTALLVSMLAAPYFFSEKTLQSWPEWAQHQAVLDLDLRGGTHFLYGAALVIAFMVVTSGRFGVFASVAVAVNVATIFGVLSLLGATLTLPGIIGIVLTIGI